LVLNGKEELKVQAVKGEDEEFKQTIFSYDAIEQVNNVISSISSTKKISEENKKVISQITSKPEFGKYMSSTFQKYVQDLKKVTDL